MSGPVTLEPLELAALLCSRVCHDLISPAGAIVNGLEVLEEDGDEETKKFALDLIKKSAKTASARLQFCRIAFGAAGSAGAQVDTGDAETMARGFMEDEKTKLTWNVPRALLPKNRVKLLAFTTLEFVFICDAGNRLLQLLLELSCACAQLFVRQLLYSRLKFIDLLNNRLD